MRSYRLLLLVPFVLLSGCNAQKEISKEKATEIVQKIIGNKEETPLVFTIFNKGAMGKGDDRVVVDLSYEYRYTSNGYYTFIKGQNGSINYDAEMYCVKNVKYDEVKFIRYFDKEKNDYVKAVEVAKDNENYATAFADLGAYRTKSVLDYYVQVTAFFKELYPTDTMKLYSSKDGQLEIVQTSEDNISTPEDDETTIKGKSVYKYENYRFVSVDIDTKSNWGNTWRTIGKIDYTKVNVELPSDWESYLTLEA